MLGQAVAAAATRLGHDVVALSRAELDVTAEAAVEAGALGARMNLALVPSERVAAVRELVERRFDGVGWRRPEIRSLPVAEEPLRH